MEKGNIWYVDISDDPNDAKGREQRGRRPAIIVGTANHIVIAIPLTTNTERLSLPFTLPIEPTDETGLSNCSVALVFQMRAFDDRRFQRKIGKIPHDKRKAIDALIRKLLKLDDDG